jgi:hypothetical protein
MSKHRDLSDDTNVRIRMLVENSAPNPDRPRLDEEREKKLAEIESRSAACYASMEDLRFKIARLVRDIDKGPSEDDEKDGQ